MLHYTADCRPHFRLGSGGGLYSAHNTFFHWCRTPSSSDPPRLRFVASTSSALPRLCPGASCASSNREFVLKSCVPSPLGSIFSPSLTCNLMMALQRLRIACGRGAPRRVRRLCHWSRLRLAFCSRARPACLRHRRRYCYAGSGYIIALKERIVSERPYSAVR